MGNMDMLKFQVRRFKANRDSPVGTNNIEWAIDQLETKDNKLQVVLAALLTWRKAQIKHAAIGLGEIEGDIDSAQLDMLKAEHRLMVVADKQLREDGYVAPLG